ncbi:kiSS-1 receptor-like [Lytechinus variegatus]|uniref:kiSS-1 receptor-like n=1 Tax=Lytechinus variegatus TaxID=7654 RepID=UPI001BB151D4|nr:kiSS-1 receptor-like [Lytechinus variegatus]
MEFDSNITSSSHAPGNVSNVSGALPLPTLIVYISFSILGIFGNGLVLFVIARVEYLQDTTNLLIVNQSLIDGISSILLLANFVLPKPPLPGKNPSLATILCGIWYSQYLYWATYIASIVNLLLLTLERYFAVVYPLRYRRHVKGRLVIVCSLIPWILGLLHMSYLITLTKIKDGTCLLFLWPNEVMQPAMGIYTFLMYFIITFTAMFWMYYRIMNTLRQASKPAVGSVHQVKDYRELARKNAVKTMLSLSLCYATCWAPNQFTYLLYCLGVNIDLGGTFYYVTVSFAFINMWINPFVYTFQYHKFQNGLKTVFGRARQGRETEVQSSQTIDTSLSQP